MKSLQKSNASILALDRSATISVAEFVHEKLFVVNFASSFRFSPRGANLGVVNFHTHTWDGPVRLTTGNGPTVCRHLHKNYDVFSGKKNINLARNVIFLWCDFFFLTITGESTACRPDDLLHQICGPCYDSKLHSESRV